MGILIKNINVGNTDISNIGDGTLTGAIDTLNNLNENQIKFGIQNGQYGYYDANDNFINFKKPTGTAEAAQVLSGYTFSNASSTGIQGAMVNRGAVASTINASQLYTIPAGYHNGSGYVRGQSLANQTTVDSGYTAAAAAQVLTGYQAWVNGSKISGSMVNRGAANSTISACTTYAIQAGYWSAGTCTGQQLDGNAVASQVYYGKTFYNNTSAKVTGSMATNGSIITTFSASTATAGAAANLIAKTNKAGYYANGASVSIAPSTHASTGTPGGTGNTTVALKPGYYNAVVINRTNAYNAGTAAAGAPTFTKIGTFGSTQLRPSSTASTFSATSITGYKNLTTQNFFFRVSTVRYGNGSQAGGANSAFTPTLSYTASSGLGTLCFAKTNGGRSQDACDGTLKGDLYCVH